MSLVIYGHFFFFLEGVVYNTAKLVYLAVQQVDYLCL